MNVNARENHAENPHEKNTSLYLDLLRSHHENNSAREKQRISMRTNLEVLNSCDLIITTSIMQSGDESVIVSV